MKIIVIAGAGRYVGKTTLLRKLKQLLPESRGVKLGESLVSNPNKEELLLPANSSIEEIKSAVESEPKYLLIEGNSILKRFEPDLAIFVEGEPKDRRDDLEELKNKCQLVTNTKIDCKEAFVLAGKIGVDKNLFGEILNTAKIKINNCQLGCF